MNHDGTHEAVGRLAGGVGAALDREALAHVFEPYFTRQTLGRGTGLGLATAHALVRQCGGHMTVASRSGEGTTFSVYLPCEAAVAEIPVATRGTILLVDDEDAEVALAAKMEEEALAAVA